MPRPPRRFHGANGLVISDEIALAIAAQAVLPVLHLGLRWYDDFVTVVVHPDQVVARRHATDASGVVHDWDEVVAGEAMHAPSPGRPDNLNDGLVKVETLGSSPSRCFYMTQVLRVANPGLRISMR